MITWLERVRLRGSLKPLAIGVVLLGCFPPSSCDAQSNLRTWHAASGGFSVEAELVDVRDDKAQLKRKDGTTLWVELKKLSLADIRFVEGTMAQAREGLRKTLGNSEPNQTAGGETQPKGSADSKPMAADGATEMEEKQERLPGWEFDADASGSKSPFAGMRDVNLVLGRVSPHELIFPITPSVWLAMSRVAGAGHQYQVANIRTGKLLDPIAIEGFASHKALSPDGTILALGVGFPLKISLFSTANGKKLKEINTPDINSINKMFFLPTQQLVLIGQGTKGVAALVDIKTGKTAKTIELENGFPSKIAVSPNGKVLAIPSHSGTVGLYDTKSGRKKTDLAIVGAKANGYINIEDLAFCRDGAELVVLGSSTAGELHAFSMKTGRLVAKHILSDRISSLFSAYSSYLGPPIESYSGNKGWILYGSAIVDREKGGPVWVDEQKPTGQPSLFRVLIDDVRQLALVGDFSASRFEIISLPLTDITKSKDMVARGGTVEDAGLPAVKIVDASTVKPADVNLNPQPYQGKLRAAGSPPKPKTIATPAELGYTSSVFFAGDQEPTCVAIPNNFTSNKKAAAVVDLTSGKVEKIFETNAATSVQDLSPGARWLASTTGKQNDRVDIYDVKQGKHLVGFRPDKEGDALTRIMGIRFLNDSTFLTINSRQAIAWELPKLKPLYKFKSIGMAFPFPSGDRFLHRSETGWLVRNSADGQPLGLLEGSPADISEIPQTISFLADESACAMLTGMQPQQKIIVWDLQTGKRTKEIILSSVASSMWTFALDRNRRLTIFDLQSRQQTEEVDIPSAESISWCNAQQLLVQWTRRDQRRFADPNNVSPTVISLLSLEGNRILWDYRLPLGIALKHAPQGQLWFAEFSLGSNRLVGAEIPSKLASERLAKAPPPKRLLENGSSLMLGVEVHISGDKLADGLFKDQVVAAIVPKLSQANINPSDRAGLKLSIEINQVVSGSGRNSPDTARLLVSCRLTDISGNTLWQRDRLIDGKQDQEKQPILSDDLRKKAWENTLAWLKETVDPATIYEKWYYRGLGESILSSSGEKLVESVADSPSSK